MAALIDPVPLGRISGCHGLQGWLRLTSYTRPPEALFEQPVLFLRREGGDVAEPRQLAETRQTGRRLFGRLDGCDSRTEAEALVGQEVVVPRAQLPAADEGHYYWSDLIGMQVVNTDAEALGQVESLFDTGAHDVLVVKEVKEVQQGKKEEAQTRLIPWPAVVIASSDPEARRLVVDWASDF